MNTEENFNALDKKFNDLFKLTDNYAEAVKEIDTLPDGVMKESGKIVNDGMTNADVNKIGAEIEKLITDMDGSDFAVAMDSLAAEKLRRLLDECSQEAHRAATTDDDLSGAITKLEEIEDLLKK